MILTVYFSFEATSKKDRGTNMIKTYIYSEKENKIIKNIDITKEKQYLTNTTDLIWVDLFDTSLEELKTVGEIFDFHPLAMEDCLQYTLRSKVDQYPNHSFFIFHATIYNEEKEEEFIIHPLNIFLGKNYVVTVHQERINAIGKAVNKVLSDSHIMKKGSDYLLYSLLDEIVDEYFPILSRLSERIDELEDEMYIHPAQEISEEFLALKRTIVLFRRVIQPKKQIFTSISNRRLLTVREEHIPYFMDLVDHLERISDSLEVYRDLVSGAMDTYFSLVSARTNNTMKSLTIITVMTAIIAAITGFFGMNVPLPYQDSPVMTVVIFIVLASIPIFVWLVSTYKNRR